MTLDYRELGLSVCLRLVHGGPADLSDSVLRSGRSGSHGRGPLPAEGLWTRRVPQQVRTSNLMSMFGLS